VLLGLLVLFLERLERVRIVLLGLGLLVLVVSALGPLVKVLLRGIRG